MAWITPKTDWETGDIPAASDFNRIEGDISELDSAKLDTSGNSADNTVAFSEATTRANIVSGETHSTLFGKIKKWFSDLKPHAFNDLATVQGTETDKAPTNKLLTDTAALKVDKTSISTVMPLSSAAASNSKVLSEKVVFNELTARALKENPSFTGQIDHITNLALTANKRYLPIGIYQVIPAVNLNYWKIFRITPIGASGVVLRITNFPYRSNPLCFADISINTYTGGYVVVNGYKYQNFANPLGTLYWTVDITNNVIDFYYKPPTNGAGIGISVSSGYNHSVTPYISFVSDGTNVLPYDTGSTTAPATPEGGSAGQLLYTDYTQFATTNNPTFTGTVTVPTPNNSTDAANKAYVDSMVIKQPDKTYVLYHATAGTNNLYLSAATYSHTYASAGAYLITISGTGSSATVDWGDGTNGTVDFTGGFNIDNQADKDKYIEVHLGTNCAVIGNNAFYGCSGLTSITIPDSVTSIGNNAFEDCRGLTSITIPNSVTSIGTSAFRGCRGLTSITIPDSVTSIGNNAFRVCRGLTSITIPDSVTSIGSYAFWSCSGLTSITIPDSVTSIGIGAFEGCSGLTSINFMGSTLPTIGSNAFVGCRIADIIAQTSALADSAATAITTAGGTLLTNYRKLY